VSRPQHRARGVRPLHGSWKVLLAVLGLVVAVLGGLIIARSAGPAASAPVAAGPLRVVSVSPAQGASADANSPIEVRFSQSLAKDSPLPTVSPPVAGGWSRPNSSTLLFTPKADFPPASTVTVTVPGGLLGMRSAAKTLMPGSTTVSWNVEPGSTLRLQQLLALLGYLPVSWTPTGAQAPGPPSVAPQPGAFAWRYPNTPPQLQALWQPGTMNVVTTGAVMAFESTYNLRTDGNPGPQVWTTLLQAAQAGQAAPHPYTYVLVNESLPETTQVWEAGSIVFSSPANTGIAAAPTAQGTWPVYARYTTTTMSGTNPDGSQYSDPGVPWVSYFNGGDALHGFIRGGYGYPQSLGCVELPYAAAQALFPLTPIGTLVTVF
jgi:peptidoglycan hydrolase-like protein with peptidoglycan-binding domain